jgi:hypothetical protein
VPLDQRGDQTVAAAAEKIALPMSRRCATVGGRSLIDTVSTILP